MHPEYIKYIYKLNFKFIFDNVKKAQKVDTIFFFEK